VRIDRSDLADKPDDAHMASRRARSTPDDLDAAARDQNNAGASHGPSGSSAAPPNSALGIERAAAYRAAVDAAYRQDAIDDGYARVGKTERETILPATYWLPVHRVFESGERRCGTVVRPREAGGAGQPRSTGGDGRSSVTSVSTKVTSCRGIRCGFSCGGMAPVTSPADRQCSAGDRAACRVTLAFRREETEHDRGAAHSG
jgi:hypothetical protein